MYAAELIWNSWENGKKIESLPDEIIPYSRNKAYKIQKQIEVFGRHTIFGWKMYFANHNLPGKLNLPTSVLFKIP